MKLVRMLALVLVIAGLASVVEAHDMPYAGSSGAPTPSCVGANSVTYVGASTVVVRDAQTGTTAVDDDAAVACGAPGAPTQGGGFIPFGFGNSIEVVDDLTVVGHGVAFQVCLDNDGDGDCHDGPPGNPCPDQQFFSHGDDGSFQNPLGPLPTSFAAGGGCPKGHPFDGYVVFICEGFHGDGANSHEHSVSKGSIQATSGGTLGGNFCGAPPPPIHQGPGVKRYVAPRSIGGPGGGSTDCGIGNNPVLNLSFGGVCFGSLPEDGWQNGNEGQVDEFGNPAGSADPQHITAAATALLDIADSGLPGGVPALYCQNLDGDGLCGGNLTAAPNEPAVDFCDSITLRSGLSGSTPEALPRGSTTDSPPGTFAGSWADPAATVFSNGESGNWAMDANVYVFLTIPANGNAVGGNPCGPNANGLGSGGTVSHT